MTCIIKSVSVSEVEDTFLKEYKLSPSSLLKEKISEMRGLISSMTEQKIMKLQKVITDYGNENEHLKQIIKNMAFWKKKKNEELKSKEFEEISKRLVLVVADLDILSGKYTLLLGYYRKLNLKVGRALKEIEADESEKRFKGRKVVYLMGETIVLGQSSSRGVINLAPAKRESRQNIFSRGLDILSSALLEPTTFIKSPTKAGEKVKARRERIRRGDKKEAVAVVAETLTATAIAASAILGGGTAAGRAVVAKVAPKLLPTTIKKAAVLATGTGILLSSPGARRLVGGLIDDPTKLGRGAGEVIEKVRKGEDTGKFTEVLKTAGIIGAGAVAVGGAVAIGKRVLGGRKAAEVVAQPNAGTIGVPTSAGVGGGAIPSQALSSTTDEPVVTPTKEPSTSVPSVVVKNNIKINNRSSANRRFINNVYV